MKISLFDKKKAEPYIPLWESERLKARTLPGYKPVIVHIKSMDHAAREDWQAKVVTNINQDTMSYDTNEKDVNKEMFIEFVEKIENLEIGETPVFLPGQLLSILDGTREGDEGIDANVNSLITEVLSAIQRRSTLEDGLAKNWKSSLGFGATTKPDELSKDAEKKQEPETEPVDQTQLLEKPETAAEDTNPPG